MDEEAVDRWFEFVEEYNANSSAPLSFVLCPNAYGYRSPGSPFGCTTLSKREWNKLTK